MKWAIQIKVDDDWELEHVSEDGLARPLVFRSRRDAEIILEVMHARDPEGQRIIVEIH